MKIPEWYSHKTQMCTIGNHSWSVARLIELARDLPVMEIPLDHLNVYYAYRDTTVREMVMHMKAVNAADLEAPILLDEDGRLMDGLHRIMKAMLTGRASVRAVRFDENPPPCQVSST